MQPSLVVSDCDFTKVSRVTTSLFLHLELPENYQSGETLTYAFYKVFNILDPYLYQYQQLLNERVSDRGLTHLVKFFRDYLHKLRDFTENQLQNYLEWLLSYQSDLYYNEKLEFISFLEELYFISKTESFIDRTFLFLEFLQNLNV